MQAITPNQQTSPPGSNTQIPASIRQSTTDSHKPARSSRLKRTLSRMHWFRTSSKPLPPAQNLRAEPNFLISGDIKTIRFDDCVQDGDAPTTDWAKAQGKPALCVGRDPILPPAHTRRLFSNRSSVGKGFVAPFLRSKASRINEPRDMHLVASKTWSVSQTGLEKEAESRQDEKVKGK